MPRAKPSRLTAAGFTVGPNVYPEAADCADLALALDSAGGIYVRNSKPALIDAVVNWLQAQDWCGPVFTRDGRGCLRHRQIGLEHPRAPDIALALRADDEVNEFGISGATRRVSVRAAS